MNLNALINFPDNTEEATEFKNIRTLKELMNTIEDLIAECEGRASSFMFTVTRGIEHSLETERANERKS